MPALLVDELDEVVWLEAIPLGLVRNRAQHRDPPGRRRARVEVVHEDHLPVEVDVGGVLDRDESQHASSVPVAEAAHAAASVTYTPEPHPIHGARMGKRQSKPETTTETVEPVAPEAPAADAPEAPAEDAPSADAPVDETHATDEPTEPAAIVAPLEGGVLIGDGEASTFRVEHDLKTDKVAVVVVKKLTGNPVPIPAEADGKAAVVVDFGDKVPGVDTFLVHVSKA